MGGASYSESRAAIDSSVFWAGHRTHIVKQTYEQIHSGGFLVQLRESGLGWDVMITSPNKILIFFHESCSDAKWDILTRLREHGHLCDSSCGDWVQIGGNKENEPKAADIDPA